MKELPYFKFDCAEWISGEITLEDLSTQGLFINICAYYWFKSGCLTLTEIKRRVKCKPSNIQSLVDSGLIKIDGENIKVSFLDEQFEERGHKSKINSINGSMGGAPKGNKNAQKNNQPLESEQPKSTNIEENKKREELEKKRREENGATKVATIEDRRNEFMNKVAAYIQEYGKEMLREFFDYWVEMNEGGKKMRFEMQKVFDISRRLKTWDKNNKFKGNGTGKKGFDADAELQHIISHANK